MCRALNISTANNLVVVLAVCHGFAAITQVDIRTAAPYCVLLGPVNEVMNLDLVQATSMFYRSLLDTGDLAKAAKLLPTFEMFTCERLFVRAFALYLRDNAVGSARRRAVERLVSKGRALFPSRPLTDIRQTAKAGLRPNDSTYRKFHRRFLLSDAPGNADRFSVTLDEILELVRSKSQR
jgi:hypothetical protein